MPAPTKLSARKAPPRKRGGGEGGRLPPAGDARAKLLDAAIALVRARGFAATSVDDLCRAAGVTKGAFFHHFPTKEALGVAAANHWSETTGALFAAAPYHDHADPFDRVLGYIDFRAGLIEGELAAFTCLVGTMVQEAYGASDNIRAACEASIFGHAATLIADIEAARALYKIGGDWSAESLAQHTQAVLQGGFILAKAKNDPQAARESAAHLKRYIELLFSKEKRHD
jgi:TetR/AcrR family transcriptional repressor of nem operon